MNFPNTYECKRCLERIIELTQKMVCDDPKGRAEFEQYYFEKYGKKFVWEQRRDTENVSTL